MRKPSTKVLALGGGIFGIIIIAVVVVVLLTRNSTESLPTGAAASVDGQVIDQKAADRHLEALATVTDGPALLPRVKECAKDETCNAFLTELRVQANDDEIRTVWTRLEAKERGVTVSAQEVKNIYLARTGTQTEAEYQQDKRDLALATKLYAKMNPGVKASEADLRAYYQKNIDQYQTPELRRANIVTTKTLAKAQRLKKELQNGAPFEKVVVKGDDLNLVARYQVEVENVKDGFSDVVFNSPKGVYVGPVKNRLGYVVFIVVATKKAVRTSFAEAKAKIRTELNTTLSDQIEAAHEKAFVRKWKAKTKCRADFESQYCPNAPATE